MNVYELDTLTLKYCGLQQIDANREAFSPLFLAAYNEGYEDVISSRYRPEIWELITLTDGNFDISQLTYEPILIKRIAGSIDESDTLDYNGRTKYRFWLRDESIVHVDMCDLNEIYVKYIFMPSPLSNDTPSQSDGSDEPILPEIHHGLLCAYAASRWLASEQKLSRADYFFEIYLREKGRVNCRTSLIGREFIGSDSFSLN